MSDTLRQGIERVIWELDKSLDDGRQWHSDYDRGWRQRTKYIVDHLLKPLIEQAEPPADKTYWCCSAPFGEHDATCKNNPSNAFAD